MDGFLDALALRGCAFFGALWYDILIGGFGFEE